jgi:hypothetical protein
MNSRRKADINDLVALLGVALVSVGTWLFDWRVTAIATGTSMILWAVWRAGQ